jgi:hypothetical protein
MQRLMRGAGMQVAPARQEGSCAVGQNCRYPRSSLRDLGMLRDLSWALCIAQGLSCALPTSPCLPDVTEGVSGGGHPPSIARRHDVTWVGRLPLSRSPCRLRAHLPCNNVVLRGRRAAHRPRLAVGRAR